MSAREEVRDGGTFRVLTFRCRNKRCADFGRTVGERTVGKALTTPETAM